MRMLLHACEAPSIDLSMRATLSWPGSPLSLEPRWEAAQLPDVVTSEVDPRQFDARRSGTAYGAAAAGAGMPRCPQALSPSPAWLRDFLSRFAQLRRELQRWDGNGWWAWACGVACS